MMKGTKKLWTKYLKVLMLAGCLMWTANATTKDEISFEDPTTHIVKLRSTNNNGWFVMDGEKIYFTKGKDQYDDSF